MIYNILLLSHFLSFSGFFYTLVQARTGMPRNKAGLIFGMGLLATGFGLVAEYYPYIPYVKVVPKLVLFLVIAGIHAAYGSRPFPKRIYYLLMVLTLLAAALGVARI